jgi:hypothetical protein
MGTLLNFLSLRGVFGSYDDAVFGAILIVIMIFAPDGILKLPIMQKLGLKIRSAFIGRRAGENRDGKAESGGRHGPA